MSASKKPLPARLILLSAPSGAGKTTLVRELLEREPSLRFSISYTTRPRRATETDGRDYFFVTDEQFRAMIAAGEFLEHARVFDNWYGTGRAHVEELLEAGHPVVLEIDWQGARQVRAVFEQACSVFILPPSVAELRRRLQARATDTQAVIERRFADAVADISHWREFDYAIINDDLAQAAAELQAIVRGDPVACSTANPALIERVRTLIGQ